MQCIEVVVGGQYGSEAKGHVTAQLVKSALKGSFDADAGIVNIRVAGPNAGHTVIDSQGREFKFRQLPVGAVIDDPDQRILCYIAPGSEVELKVLLDEVDQARQAGYNPTIAISGEATLIEDRHFQGEANAELVAKIGSTGKGIGAARADRLMRGANRIKDDASVLAALDTLGITVVEPEGIYANDILADMMTQHIIIEGTQGFGLGLHAGHYPQVTSSDCTAADFLAMAQVSPWRCAVKSFQVFVVARAYPIRVAGNSGPLEGETTWEDLGLPEERTTVTQKVRRVGAWDANLVARAVQANGGHHCVRVVLTMADQVIPEVRGFDGSEAKSRELSAYALRALESWVEDIQSQVGAQVAAVTTSPSDIVWVQNEGVEVTSR